MVVCTFVRPDEDLVMRRNKEGSTQTPPSRVCSIHEKPSSTKKLFKMGSAVSRMESAESDDENKDNIKLDIKEKTKNTPGSIL